MAGISPLMHRELSLDVAGADQIAGLDGPALIIANHASHLDTAVLLSTLPADRRRKTAVAAAADYFFESWWRATGTAVAFNTFPIERRGGSSSAALAELLEAGWSLVLYPEGTRSADGYVHRFRMGAAWLAVTHQIPVIPVGIRGTYAAMPRGRSWIVRGRPRVSVRYGEPIHPTPGQSPRQLAPQLSRAVNRLIVEDSTSWWDSQRSASDVAPAQPRASWRRIWTQTQPPREGNRTGPARIWRD